MLSETTLLPTNDLASVRSTVRLPLALWLLYQPKKLSPSLFLALHGFLLPSSMCYARNQQGKVPKLCQLMRETILYLAGIMISMKKYNLPGISAHFPNGPTDRCTSPRCQTFLGHSVKDEILEIGSGQDRSSLWVETLGGRSKSFTWINDLKNKPIKCHVPSRNLV